MLKRLSPSERLALLLEHFAAGVRDAFLLAFSEIRASISLVPIVERLERHDIEGAIRAMNIEAPALNPVLDEVAKAYNGGGNATIEDLPALRDGEGYKLVLRFDARDPVAEAWLKDHSASFVTGIVQDQQQSIRAALAEGQARGLSGRASALDIVGRIDRATGQRAGGIIGLTSQQAEFVRNYQAELKSGGANALKRALRDRRFDKTVAKAIAEGKPIPAETVSKMVTAYEGRLLKYRGEVVGRTESAAALGASSEEAMRQNIVNGKIDMSLIDGVWHTILDGRERDSHGAMDGQIQPWGRTFVSGAGNQLRYPGDENAPASERANCRCNRTFSIRKEPRIVH